MDYKTERLVEIKRNKKRRNKRKQRLLYEKGKKRGGKFTHPQNAKGNTVTFKTSSKIKENEEKLKRKRILEKIRSMKK